jgi:hypothetical protein
MNKIERPTINLSAPIELKANPETGARRFSINAYTGRTLKAWFGSFVIDVAGIQTKEKVPILREHERDRIVGWSEKVSKDNGSLLLEGYFSQSTKDGQEVLALADEGFPWQASMGIQPLRIKELNADERATVNGMDLKGPLEIWSETLLGETSMVSWGRDNDTSMSLLSEGEQVSVDYEKQEVSMTTQELKEKHPDIYREVFDAGAASVDLSVVRADGKDEGINAERERVAALLSVDGADDEARQKAITEGLAVDAAYKLFFEAERGKKAKGLQELQSEASLTLGYEAPKEPENLSGDPGQIVSQKAIALSKSEKIGLAEATSRILAENKPLAAKYYGQYTE